MKVRFIGLFVLYSCSITTNKEVTPMKAAILKRRFNRFVNYAPYPNAITPRQMFHKVLDILLVTASGAGIAAIVMLWLVIL